MFDEDEKEKCVGGVMLREMLKKNMEIFNDIYH